MTRRLTSLIAPAVFLAISFLAVPPSHAQEWYDLYEKGLEALGKKQAVTAAGFFERAIRRQPTPGENVLTYGTNRLPEYHPYLRLAEALVAAGEFDRARKTLERSEASGREPSAGRLRVMAMIDAGTGPEVAEALKVAAPAPAASANPEAQAVLPPGPSPTDEPRPFATSTPPIVSETPGVRVAEPPTLPAPSPTPEPKRPISISRPAEGTPVRVVPSPQSAATSLEVITKPIRADVGATGAPAPSPSRAWLWSLALVLVIGLVGMKFMAQRAPHAAELPATRLGETESLRSPIPDQTEESTILTTTEARTPLPSATLPAVGAPSEPGRFGGYELLEQIGRGGMAVVFKAHRQGEFVALKRPLAAFLSEAELLERFVREAEIGRTLNHPNIIRIFEKGRIGDMPYFTMELVDGETLHARVRRDGALSPRQASQIVKQVAEALDYSHLKGVIHRDLKPSNIMILRSGVVKVMDYGIARSARLEALTASGAFLGTPEYVAPETAEGGRTESRSDLYSLGVVFYEILTGVRPFVAETPFATLKKICSEAPTPPSAVRMCPAELEAIVLKLLHKKPEHRHASAEELLNDLNDYLIRAG